MNRIDNLISESFNKENRKIIWDIIKENFEKVNKWEIILNKINWLKFKVL